MVCCPLYFTPPILAATRGISGHRSSLFFPVMSALVPTFQPCDDGLPLRTAVQSFDDVLHMLAHCGDGYAEPFGYLAIREILFAHRSMMVSCMLVSVDSISTSHFSFA